ncbi:MAG: pyruvate formate lyase-activating protein, partial [Candidatus Hecatellales archaeon]
MWRIIRPDAVRVLGDEKCRRSLKRYFAILEERSQAKFRIARRLKADFTGEEPLEELWSLHERLTREYYELEAKLDHAKESFETLKPVKPSYLDLKVEIARRILRECHFCERRCRVNRLEGERGFCRCGVEAEVSSFFSHMGEEPEL